MVSFAIVVPTRNRPRELERTLAGLALLEYSDYEIIVSDNSNSEFFEENRRIAEALTATGKVRYVRPRSELNMVDHWEFAIGNSRADYTGFVTDRMTLVPDSLSVIAATIRETGCDSVSFGHTTLDKFARGLPKLHRSLGKSPRLQSAETHLQEFSQSIFGKKNPRLLNSFASQELISRIKSEYGSVFDGISPDYNFMFRVLSLCKMPIHIGRPLTIIHSVSVSNGVSVARFRNNRHSTDFLKRLNSEQQQLLGIGPIVGETRLLPNSILREYTLVGSRQKGRPFPMINPERFVEACLESLSKAEDKSNPDYAESQARLNQFAAETLGRGIDAVPARSGGAVRRLQKTVRRMISRRPGKGADDVPTAEIAELMKRYSAITMSAGRNT